jgi:capsular polysaccharide biosynthesis protein
MIDVLSRHIVESYISNEQMLFSASSYLIDRIVPEPERIILPSVVVPNGTIYYTITDDVATTSSQNISKREKLIARSKDVFKAHVIDDGYIIDLRISVPENWAHSLNSHLPLAFFLRDKIQKQFINPKVFVLLDDKTPNFILDLYKLFNFEVMKTSCDVTGKVQFFKVDNWSCLRSIARQWVEEFCLTVNVLDCLSKPKMSLPKKVFLSRKDTRTLINEGEAENYLSAKGFTKIYPEMLSVSDQLAIFSHADELVALHGAAIGPLLYRPKSAPPLKLIEIFTPGHMTKYYRVMADQVGAEWVGVRGKIEPEHVKEAYNFSKKFREYSLTPFTVDLVSLESAFEYLNM